VFLATDILHAKRMRLIVFISVGKYPACLIKESDEDPTVFDSKDIGLGQETCLDMWTRE